MAEFRAMGHTPLSLNRRNKLVQHFKITEIKRNYGADHFAYKGGHITGSGYKVISRIGKSNLYEHRVVAEQMIRRPLLPGEVVHHKDGNRLNNSPDNLQVMTASEHAKIESKLKNQRIHSINPETIEAARILYGLGWKVAHIARALRCESRTIKGMLVDTD